MSNKRCLLMFRSGRCLHTLLYLTSKWLTSSSAALVLVLICLIAVINCTNNRSSIDVLFATAVDMFCCVLYFVFHIFIRISYILFDLIWYHFLHYNWKDFVRLNKGRVVLRYVIFVKHTWHNKSRPQSDVEFHKFRKMPQMSVVRGGKRLLKVSPPVVSFMPTFVVLRRVRVCAYRALGKHRTRMRTFLV